MKLLVLVINKEEHLEEVMELFIELGVPGATVLDSMGMGRYLTHNVPIFASFRDLMPDSRAYNKTVLSIMDDELIPKVVAGVEQILGSLDQPGVGVLFTVPVDQIRGVSRGFNKPSP